MSTSIVQSLPTDPIHVTAEQVELIKRTVAAGATDAELQLFMFDCRRQGVHPLDKLLHFTKRQGRYVPITSIDLMRSRAVDTGEMAGSDDPQFTYEAGNLLPVSAHVSVYRLTSTARYAYSVTARWDEYYPGDGQPGFMWRKMPHVMLGKVAEALALRKAFPRQLAGLYAREEMDQAGDEVRDDVDRKVKALRHKSAPITSIVKAVESVDEPTEDIIVEDAIQVDDLEQRNTARRRFFGLLEAMIDIGIQPKTIKANTDSGRTARRKLLRALLAVNHDPEPNQMTLSEWNKACERVQKSVNDWHVAQGNEPEGGAA